MDAVKVCSPRYSLLGRQDNRGKGISTPGPAHYNPQRPVTAPGISLKSRIDVKPAFVTPSPAAYQVREEPMCRVSVLSVLTSCFGMLTDWDYRHYNQANGSQVLPWWSRFLQAFEQRYAGSWRIRDGLYFLIILFFPFAEGNTGSARCAAQGPQDTFNIATAHLRRPYLLRIIK